jgi:hypothetical protein
MKKLGNASRDYRNLVGSAAFVARWPFFGGKWAQIAHGHPPGTKALSCSVQSETYRSEA